ncbi:uncharacterized protein LOC143602168 [Bidens hawaiensis]|uniref:uncharacterized protein LOC143602168 n=1 Tax=Bidens hawaiensis TaxID=980011 RepID=UPI004049817F
MGDSETLISNIEASDPLYLHASDSNSLTIANAMLFALQVKNKVGFIDGTCKRSLDNEVLGRQWDRCNSVVLSWIRNSISEELYLGQVFSRKALDVWIDLKETYNKVDGSVVFGLYQKINSISQNGSSVSEYYHKLNTLWKQFNAMVQLPSCSCNASDKFNDHGHLIKLMQFLMGLDDVYQSVRTSLLTRDPLLTIKIAFSIVSREESHRNFSGTSKAQTQNMGFVSKSNQSFDTKKKFNKGPNPNLKCTHCNKIGHTVERCFELVRYPQGKNDQSTTSSGASLTSEQVTKLLSLLNEKQGDSAHASHVGGKSLGSFSASSFNPKVFCFASNFPALSSSEWIVDSVKHPNGSNTIVTKIGSIKLSESIILNDVLVVPEYHDLLTRKILVTGSQLDGLYFCGGATRSLKINVSLNDFDSNIDVSVNNLNFFDLYDDGLSKVSLNDLGPNDELRVTNDHSSEDQPPSSHYRTVDDSIGSRTSNSLDGTSEVDQPRVEHENNNNPEVTSNQTPLRRSSRASTLPKKLSDFVVEGKVKYGFEKVVNYSNLSIENLSFVSSLNKTVEPRTYQEAATDYNWISAMNDEMSALYRNNTWNLVDLPKDRKAIGCKWVYKIKYKANGEIDRYKARLVAKGYNQREGVDFDETFSPVVKMVTVRCVITLAVENDWPLFQLDINNAFLYGELNENVYMKFPEGYFSKNDTHVCKLVKSLYGLKQAPRMWNAKLVSALLKMGFVQSACDYSLFVKNDNSVFIVLLVYVDDIVLTGNNVSAIEEIKEMLRSIFLIKDLGLLKYFLGIEVLRSDVGVCLSQRKYCMELLTEYDMSACKPVNTPIEQNYVVMNMCEKEKNCFKKYNRFLSQFMHSPSNAHLQLALRLLRYLKRAPSLGILFKKGDSRNLTAYADSDWAKCLDTRRSVTGYCIFLGQSLVAWKSKKQLTVSRSSAEAEYRAMCACAEEIIWIKNLLKELKVIISLPVSLNCDNNAAISIAANPVFHDRTKHFEIDLFFLREKISSGVIKTESIRSDKQLADVLTKGLLGYCYWARFTCLGRARVWWALEMEWACTSSSFI